ncbi:MAG: hypothetical protein J1F12_08260 [Muribaculaceae bacterium]|nr:hypothetical protein [Muribaculaceae bacterium]
MNKFKSLLYAFTIIMMAGHWSQTLKAEEDCPLPVMVKVVDENNVLSEANINFLTQKLMQVVSYEGYGGQELAYLCLMASVSETNKEIISGNRPLVVLNAELDLVLCSLKSGEQFGATSIPLSGQGVKESQAFQKALARVSRHNQALNAFMRQARKKVFEYYESHIPSMIRQANLLTQRGEYEEALYMLSSVPPCCNNYDPVEEAIINIWSTYINRECSEQMAKANAIWRSTKNQEGALLAAAYIGAINRESMCAQEADALLAEIESKLDADYARELALEDEEREFAKEQIREEMNLKKEEINIRKQKIDAIREIALSFSDSVVGPLAKKLPSMLLN